MTLQMALLESKMEGKIEGKIEGEIQKAEAIARKLIRRGRPLQEIHEDTDLSLERINELIAASNENNHAK